jgi:hypothetical protein
VISYRIEGVSQDHRLVSPSTSHPIPSPPSAFGRCSGQGSAGEDRGTCCATGEGHIQGRTSAMLSLDERAVNARLERMGSCGMWIAIPRIEDRAIEIGQYREKGTKISKRPGVVLVALVLVQAGRSNLCPESPTDDIPPHDT